MPSQVVPFRIRQRKDDDLAEAFKKIPTFLDNSEIIREALRMYFFSAPTPLRDSYLNVETKHEIMSLPLPSKEIQPTTKPSNTPILSATVKEDDDVDDKLNRSLGF